MRSGNAFENPYKEDAEKQNRTNPVLTEALIGASLLRRKY